MKRKIKSNGIKPTTFQPNECDETLYANALRYLFDRPIPEEGEEEWYWDIDNPEFPATPLEWTQIQTRLFANAGTDLIPYSNEQVGLGLHYVMSNTISDMPFMAIDSSVSLENAMQMMQAFPLLWENCIGPRLQEAQLAGDETRIKKLAWVCFMWFDVWPTFSNAQEIPAWRDAMWNLLSSMLDMPYRAVQMSALHGIGHHGYDCQTEKVITQCVKSFIATVKNDDELVNYAEMAATGFIL